MTKLKEKLQTKGEILDKLYVQKTPHIVLPSVLTRLKLFTK